jgi:ABC-2 type transport system permease protein
MNHAMSMSRKELRAYFLSPVALLFLATFLVVTLFMFFWKESFFTRNIADVRPLFSWLPVLLVFLCSALTMRLWSEEQKMGTIEVLLTLPVKPAKLVFGKFLAALELVAIALLLTLPIPLTVSLIGDIDWGPVVGGYIGALLLAAAYISIGLCVSASTDNQIVALIGSVALCGLFYVVGSDGITSLVGIQGTEILQSIGTGARFESIRRGVLDLRDLVYYGALTVTFLVINTVIIESKGWSKGPATAPLRHGRKVMVALVAANAIGINILLAPITGLRIDMTENKEYSISPVTKQMVRGLPEPLLIRGYFSQRAHPLLDPLVPRIRDVIQEYGVVSNGKVRAEFVDPQDSEEDEKEANSLYGIKSFPFQVQSRHQRSVANAYFSVLVQYGDEHEVLNFDDLIEVQVSGSQDVEVRLRNLEYDLTRAIKKVAYGFQTLDAVFAGLGKDAEFTAFITPESLPENYQDLPGRLETALQEIQAQSGGKFKYSVVNPDAPGAEETRETLERKYGFEPYAKSLIVQDPKDLFFAHMLLKVGDKYERILPGEGMSEADIKSEITAALKRSTPGFLKTVGLVQTETPPPPMPPQFQQQAPPNQDVTRLLRQTLSETYTVRTLDLKDGRVPGDIDFLLVYAPKNLDAAQTFAIDQYLMRGGSVAILGGRYELDPNSQFGLSVNKVDTGLEGMLASYGITIEDKLVLDPQSAPFPIPVTRNLGGIQIRDIQLVDYPFFVDVRKNAMDDQSPVVSGLPSVTLQWASPVRATAPEGKSEAKEEETSARKVVTLLSSSKKAWTQSDTTVQPDFRTYPDLGFPVGKDASSQPLAVAVSGKFESYFAGKKNPGSGTAEGQIIKSSPDSARLVVVGTSAVANDVVLNLSRQTGADRGLTNLQFVNNMVDWGLEDVELLSIRSRGTYARTLLPQDARLLPLSDEGYEYGNYILAILALLLVYVVTLGRRKHLKPIPLTSSTRSKVRGGGPHADGSRPAEA